MFATPILEFARFAITELSICAAWLLSVVLQHFHRDF